MKRKAAYLIGMILIFLILAGCGGSGEGTRVVLTTGFDMDEIFRIESTSCSLSEVMVYLTNTQNRYENIYGKEIWETSLRESTLEQKVKDTVLAELAQIKVMNLLAEKYEVALTEKEAGLAELAGAEYFASLNETEASMLGVDEKTIVDMYGEYAVADKVYEYIIKDINPEISDDEARTMTVEHILIKTYSLDGNGQRVPFDDEEKEEAYQRAVQVLEMARAGEDFESLVSRYNEDSRSQYSFGIGETEAAFEQAAFELGTDEISDIVETEYGYHII